MFEAVGLIDERLYYNDSYCMEFEGVVVQETERDGKWLVRLNQSAFYPTSGGQPHDTGRLGDSRVLDVYVENEAVVHVVNRPIGEGQKVTGRIDWERRFDHMQQHTGQHILSACFEQILDADTVGFHLGEDSVTIDLAISELNPLDARQVEVRANQVIWENHPIVARFVTEEELQGLTLRHAPKVEKDIRIVSIGEFDHNACGGTHPSRSGEVGMIKILRTDRMRGGVRLTFACGNRALQDYDGRLVVLKQLGNQLSTGDRELPDALSKLQQNLTSMKKQSEQWKKKWLGLWAKDVVSSAIASTTGERVFCAILEDVSDTADLKFASNALAEVLTTHQIQGVAAAVTAKIGERVFLQAAVLGDGDTPFDANLAVKSVLGKLNGKGGGSKAAAQGSAPFQAETSLTNITDWLRHEFENQVPTLHF